MQPRLSKALAESKGLLRGPQRLIPLIGKLVSDKVRLSVEQKNLYSYTRTKLPSGTVLQSGVGWMLDAQRANGGIPAYYSLLTGYSESYPETTGYIVPTLYDFGHALNNSRAIAAAQQAIAWLLSLQMPSGAFPGGLLGGQAQASVFNSGQILQGLVRAYVETNRADVRQAAIAAGSWLSSVQKDDGSWSGPEAYQNTSHTYYSMVAWALAELSERVPGANSAPAAEKNLDWVLSHFRPSGWVDGINLRGHPNYLHFIAYILQGVLESAIRLRRRDGIEAVAKAALVLLRKFETNKFLAGAYQTDFTGGHRFICVTGNSQISCVWLRLFEVSGDLRYLNAALKMNEMLKQLIPMRGGRGIAGGVSGSYPIWGSYQPFRYISWGCKFLADALLLEERLTKSFASTPIEALPCAS
jgi:hypothetical protein